MTETRAATSRCNTGDNCKTRTAPESHCLERIISYAEMCKLLGCNRVTLWRMIGNKRFPAPLEISGNKRGWPESDYRRWLAEQVAKRDGKR